MFYVYNIGGKFRHLTSFNTYDEAFAEGEDIFGEDTHGIMFEVAIVLPKPIDDAQAPGNSY